MPHDLVERPSTAYDPVYAVLRDDGGFLSMDQILRRLPVPMEVPAFEQHLAHLGRDFHIEVDTRKTGDAYKLGTFKAFVGQDDHLRHEAFLKPPGSADTRHAGQKSHPQATRPGREPCRGGSCDAEGAVGAGA